MLSWVTYEAFNPRKNKLTKRQLRACIGWFKVSNLITKVWRSYLSSTTRSLAREYIIVVIIIIIIIYSSTLSTSLSLHHHYYLHLHAICGLSLLLVLSFAPRGFSPGTPVFPSPQKPIFPNSNSTRNQVDEEPLCGCATSKSLFIYLLSSSSPSPSSSPVSSPHVGKTG